jgi:hypothetical protein
VRHDLRVPSDKRADISDEMPIKVPAKPDRGGSQQPGERRGVYGVIGLDALPGLDGSDTYNENKTAQMISTAVAELGLASKRSAYVLMLHPSGKHAFRWIG